MKKLCSLLLALVLLGAMIPQGGFAVLGAEQRAGTVIASGSVYECDYDWTLTDDGVLTVSGSWYINGYAPWCDYMDDIRHLVLEEGIETIGGDAFFGYYALETVTFPDTLTQIEMCAFSDCVSLKTLSFPDGLREVQEMAFAECRSLTAVELPDSVTELGDEVFRGCDSLKSAKLPRGLKRIGYGLFDRCTSLTAIEIPEGVTEIGNAAFRECDRLRTITIPEGVTRIGRDMFAYCASLNSIIIPESVTDIAECAFSCCSSLENITIHKNVKTIGEDAFLGCYQLENITFLGEPPVFGENVFHWVRATARCDRAQGWTDEDMQNYGGTLFWTDLDHVHEWGEFPLIPPTCTESGWYIGWGCMTCGWTKREPEEIYPEHNWDAGVYTEPTTTADGYTTYTCLGCGKTKVVIHKGSQLPDVPAIAILQNPEDQIALQGESAQFTVIAGGENLRYQWQYKRPDGTKWIDTAMEGAATATVTVTTTAARDGYMYRCRITDKQGNVVYTESATLDVVFFQRHPAETFATTGTTVQFTVATPGDAGVTCQWQYSADGVTWIETATDTYELTVTATTSLNGCQYRCVLILGEKQLVSKSAVLHVSEPVAFTAQPASATAAVGATVPFTVAADNAFSYQWQYYNPVHKVWKNTAAQGNRTDCLQITVKNHNHNYQYRCIVTGLDGVEYYSDIATLTIG